MSALLGVGNSAVARPTEPAELTRYLYERYGQRVFTFCYSRLRNREEAQDAAQTTFIYVLRSLQRGVEPEFELAWLLKIAFNVCRGVRRSAGRASAAIEDVEDVDSLAAPARAEVEGRERLEALRDGLGSLPETQRRAILLREWQGLSYAEIADELGLSVSAVETLLFRARRNLASRLQHVRSGVGAFNVAAFAPFFRSMIGGGLAKLGLIGATASIALVPIIAAEIKADRVEGDSGITLARSAGAPTAKREQTGQHTSPSTAAQVGRKRADRGLGHARPTRIVAPSSGLVGGSGGAAPASPNDSGSGPAASEAPAPPATNPAPAPPSPQPTVASTGVGAPVELPPVTPPAVDQEPLEILAPVVDVVDALP